MIAEIIETFSDKVDAETEDAVRAWQRGVLTDRDLAEWIKFNKDFALMLQRYLADTQVVYADAAA